MKYKEKLFLREIKAMSIRRDKLKELIYANPLGEIIKIRQEIFKKIKGVDPDKAIKIVKIAANREKELFLISKKQLNSGILITKLVELEGDIADLQNDLSFIQRNKGVTK